MVARGSRAFWSFAGLAFALVCLPSAVSAESVKIRDYRLSHPLARPVVRILSDEGRAQGRYGSATGVLVGRCDIVLTARHVAVGAGGLKVDAMDIYSPQIRGKSVTVLDDPAARAIWPRSPVTAVEGNFDSDLAVLKLSACPTHSYVPMDQVRPIQFSDLKTLKAVGFACDSGDKRAPEFMALRGKFAPTAPGLGISRSLTLTPGARPGQSGSPIYALIDEQAPALTMIMVATVRRETSPVGCGANPETGRSKAGVASYGAVLTQDFIDTLRDYVRTVNKRSGD